jgi:hypothetical protein
VAFREYATIVACERDAQGSAILETKDQRLPYKRREIHRPDGVERTFDAVNAGDRNARHIVHTLISGYPITNLADDVALCAQVADARIFLDELHHSWGPLLRSSHKGGVNRRG